MTQPPPPPARPTWPAHTRDAHNHAGNAHVASVRSGVAVPRLGAAVLCLMVATAVALILAPSPTLALAHGHDPVPQWGTYRPNLYFGTRLRSPHSLLTGLAWFSLNDNDYAGLQSMRHACDQSHNMQGYGYHAHNGRDYANQTINDATLNVRISTEWIAHHEQGDWVARIRGEPLDPAKPTPKIGVLYYAGFDGPGELAVGSKVAVADRDQTGFIRGSSPNLGNFAMYVQLPPSSPTSSWASVAASPAWARSGPRTAPLPMPAGKVWQAADLTAQVLSTHARATIAQRQQQGDKEYPAPADLIALPERDLGLGQDQAIAGVVQMAFQGSWEMDIVFVSQSQGRKPEDLPIAARKRTTSFSETAAARMQSFLTRFTSTFPLPSTLPANAAKLSHYLLSNLLGGIGFFHGPARTNPTPDNEAALFDWLYLSDPDDEDAQLAHMEWKAHRDAQNRDTLPMSLFTGTPSRSFFPRGFLWDEGFHQLVVGAWDHELSKEVLASWFAEGVQDKQTGWIAREQILGEEARSRVPEEFQVQSPHIANPPTLGLAVMALAQQYQKMQKATEDGKGMFSDPGAEQQMVGEWSQGLIPPGASNDIIRSFLASLQLHYNWLHSTQHGIPDDFGRSIPNPYVYRWRGRTEHHNFASGLDDFPRSDPPNIGELHVDLQAWMAWYAQLIADLAQQVGDNALAKDMRSKAQLTAANLFNVFWDAARGGGFGDVAINYDDESIVNVRKGYVSLVPFVLGLVDKAQHKKQFDWSIQLIRELSRPGNGVMSLHPDDEAFGKGENYWRGAVWMNWQYLVLRALKRSGPEVQDLYAKIRGDVIRVVTQGFAETGFVHENYDGLTGKPRGSHPFTGWTSLVLLIMSERYH
ncbi:glycoside hydrolase [Catenaria anguillulae PL171]|uniref:Mannosyl-oligosaccharide glucosidase n=1 Tax=Catenaria anguillulae PL171 TaxID=765915 RepID=A0A1Y2I2V9_9FUNG|nr:glycoside hydrolase [Catenaria anguillulae PL171]